jgi:hypothetical protein
MYDENDGGNPAVLMTHKQFETLIAQIAATSTGASPTPDDLTEDQQKVVLQYQLLRNGLIRHSLPAETVSQVLIGITQRVCDDKVELVADNQIPQAAVSLTVTIGADRRHTRLLSRIPGTVFGDVEWCKSDPGVSLVEFIDTRRNTVAAGIPSPLAKAAQDPLCDKRIAELVTAKFEELYEDMATAMANRMAGNEVLIVSEEAEVSDDPDSDESSANKELT